MADLFAARFSSASCIHVCAVERIVTSRVSDVTGATAIRLHRLSGTRRENLEQRGSPALESHLRPFKIQPVRTRDLLRVHAQYAARLVEMFVERCGLMPQASRVV